MAKTGIGMVGGAIVNIAILAAVQFWFDEQLAGSISVGLLAVATITAVHFFRTGRASVFAQATIWASAASAIVIHVLLGGYEWSGGYVMWGISNVALAASYLPRRTTSVMTGIYVIAATAFAFLETTFQSWRERPDPGLATAISIQIFIASVAFVAPALLLMRDRIFEERTKSRNLMLNILPVEIADRLQEKPGVIAERHDHCSILFADLVGFTPHSKTIEPEELVAELNVIFTRFDKIVAVSGGEKIKTIGDGYMAAFGVPADMEDHAVAACRTAIGFIESMADLNEELATSFELRVGLAAGPSVAGVIGESKFAYDIWSDAVILASRLESSAEPGQILVSEDVSKLAAGEFSFQALGSVALKGAGSTSVFALHPGG